MIAPTAPPRAIRGELRAIPTRKQHAREGVLLEEDLTNTPQYRAKGSGTGASDIESILMAILSQERWMDHQDPLTNLHFLHGSTKFCKLGKGGSQRVRRKFGKVHGPGAGALRNSLTSSTASNRRSLKG